MSRKSERLVNLTIALLATKRYLTKSEIFNSVAGYTGDPEARDRMFERDKDDLRSLGISIELGTFDPLFEDEAGYRIRPESYALQLKGLDATSMALLSEAARLWHQAALGEPAQSGLRKLKSLGISSDLDAISEITSSHRTVPEQLPDLIEAISHRRTATFEYLNPEMKSDPRNVEPYRLSNSRGYWYLIARDIEKSAMRTFRIDRFNSTVTLGARSNSYEIDIEALDQQAGNFPEALSFALILLRKGKSPALRKEAEIVERDAEWDEVRLQYQSEEQLIREILWAGENAILLEPAELRNQLISALQMVVSSHG